MIDPVVTLAVRGGLALLFASAALHKLRGRAAFTGVLAAYRVLPAPLVAAAAVAVAAAELLVAAALAIGSALGPVGAVGLLATYSFAIGVNLARGRRTIDCGCGALGARQPISEWLLARNALLAGAALVLVPAPVAARALSWIDLVSIAGAVAVAALVWTAAHGLAAAAARAQAASTRGAGS
jgi:hypothetical protein